MLIFVVVLNCIPIKVRIQNGKRYNIFQTFHDKNCYKEILPRSISGAREAMIAQLATALESKLLWTPLFHRSYFKSG